MLRCRLCLRLFRFGFDFVVLGFAGVGRLLFWLGWWYLYTALVAVIVVSLDVCF